MLKLLIASALLVVVAPGTIQAHCDSIGGPVATAALNALETGNVNLVLPYAPASAEPELTAAFNQASVVRTQNADAKAMADRLKSELPQMLAEHQEIVTALGALTSAALEEGHNEHARFAKKLILHARTEEEVLYPAMILFGEYLKLKGKA